MASEPTFEEVSRHATELLNNKQLKKEFLYKTKMCTYANDKTNCRWGRNCDRAHDLSELRFVKCPWGKFCFKTDPSYLGVVCEGHHPSDGDFDKWVALQKSANYKVNSSQLCPNMSETSPCTVPDCNFAHHLSEIKFHGECDCFRDQCKKANCLNRHQSETRESFVMATKGIHVEQWMKDDSRVNHTDRVDHTGHTGHTDHTQPTSQVDANIQNDPDSEDEALDHLAAQNEQGMYFPNPAPYNFSPSVFHMYMPPHLLSPTPPPHLMSPLPGMCRESPFPDIVTMSLEQMYQMKDTLRLKMTKLMHEMCALNDAIAIRENNVSETSRSQMNSFLQDQHAWVKSRYGDRKADAMISSFQK